MKINKVAVIVVILLFLFNVSGSENSEADTLVDFTNIEISNDGIEGFSSQDGVLEVFIGEERIGKGDVINHQFKIKFTREIVSSLLVLQFHSIEGVESTSNFLFEPVTNIRDVNDKEKILAGTGDSEASISAHSGNTSLTLKKFNTVTGEFEFSPLETLAAGSIIQIISEKNGVKSIRETTVREAPIPNKPTFNPVSNKDTFISGGAEAFSTVYVQVARNRVYSITLLNSADFKIALENGPLKEGTLISAYVIDRAGRKSDTVSISVIDKIHPLKPILSAVTEQSFILRGRTNPRCTVTIERNSKLFKKIDSDALGNFALPIPLQKNGVFFEVYAIDRSGNKSLPSKVVVSPQKRLPSKVLSAPLILQKPELPRGCEVTSLAMLLDFAGVKADKMTLARQVKKDPAKFWESKGIRHFGNPNYGFVGDMFTYKNPGYGVYNQPIESLASRYLPNRIINLSGQPFDNVLNQVSAGHPVWIITTSVFRPVPEKYWETWYSSQGKIHITYYEHSVLITGYDSKNVYFNDPLDPRKNKSRPLKEFISGWKQFGNQALSYY